MLQDAYVSQALARGAYYWFVPPGICIMLAVMAGFFIGRGYEELLFPRLRGALVTTPLLEFAICILLRTPGAVS